MASVTDYELQVLAKDIVSEFKSGGTLNELVIKKASSEGFNKEQTERLIERTNSEAFLNLYPSTTEFEVADPKIVLSKKAAEHERSSSFIETPTEASTVSYRESLDKDFDSIFGLNSGEKTASYREEGLASLEPLTTKLASERNEDAARLRKVAARMQIEHASNNVWKLYKEAALAGALTEDLELELFEAYPEHRKLASELVDIFNFKLANFTSLDSRLFKRAAVDIDDNFGIYEESPMTKAFGSFIRAADQGRDLLGRDLLGRDLLDRDKL